MIDIASNEVRYIARLRRRALQVLDEILAAHGIGHGTYKYMYALYLEDCVSQQRLADLVGDDKAATTRALARLEAVGLVARQSDPSDRRVLRVSLTAKGQKLQPTVEQAIASAIDAMTIGLSAAETQAFRALLAKAAEALPSPLDS